MPTRRIYAEYPIIDKNLTIYCLVKYWILVVPFTLN